MLLHPLGLLTTLALFVLTVFVRLPVAIDHTLYLLFFFTVSRNTELIDQLSQGRYRVPVLLAFVVLYAVRAAGWLTWNPLLNSLLIAFVGCTGAALLLHVSHLMPETGIGHALRTLSGYSFIIYLLHQPFLVSGVSGVLLKLTNLPYIVIGVCTLCLGIALPILADRFVIRRLWWLRCLLLGDLRK